MAVAMRRTVAPPSPSGNGAPTTMTPLDALRRHWWILVALGLIGAALGVGYGLQRDPVYSSDAELSVGRVDVSTQAIPGFAVASQTLADTYSRAIVASPVVNAVAKKAHLSRSEVHDQVTASPIPQTATMQVIADAGSRDRAVSLANNAARSLISYVHTVNRFNPQSNALLKRYRRAADDFSRAKLLSEGAQHHGSLDDRAHAQARLLEAKLRMQEAAGLYGSSQQGQASPNSLEMLAPAATATSDRASTTQRAGLAGAVGGVLLGGLVAIALGQRRQRSR